MGIANRIAGIHLRIVFIGTSEFAGADPFAPRVDTDSTAPGLRRKRFVRERRISRGERSLPCSEPSASAFPGEQLAKPGAAASGEGQSRPVAQPNERVAL